MASRTLHDYDGRIGATAYLEGEAGAALDDLVEARPLTLKKALPFAVAAVTSIILATQLGFIFSQAGIGAPVLTTSCPPQNYPGVKSPSTLNIKEAVTKASTAPNLRETVTSYKTFAAIRADVTKVAPETRAIVQNRTCPPTALNSRTP